MRDKLKKLVKCVCAMFMVALFLYGLLITFKIEFEPINEVEWEEGWSVSVNGEQLESEDNIRAYVLEDLRKGDVITMSAIIPEGEWIDLAMTIVSYHSTVEIYIDGNEIYSYGLDRYSRGKFLGSGYIIVDIPDEYIGHTMEIVMIIAEDGALTSFDVPLLSESEDAYVNICYNNANEFIISSFLCMIGIIMLLVGVVSLCYNAAFVRLFYIGMFSFILGLWCICDTKMLQIFNITIAGNSTVKYVAFYLAPVVFLMLFMDIRRNISPWRLNLLKVTAVANAMFCVLVGVLHFTDIAHYYSFINYYYMLIIASMLVVLFACFGGSRTEDVFGSSVGWGMTVLCVCVLIEIGRYIYLRDISHATSKITSNYIAFGVLCFVMIVVVGYLRGIQNSLIEESERDWINQHIFHDELTGLYNRTKFRQATEELRESKNSYAMVNLDLDGLKTTNDSLGHENGDKLIVAFANILISSFGNIGDIFRLGGDEFLVVVPRDYIDDIPERCEFMVKQCQRKSTEYPFAINASYGVVNSLEFPGSNPEKVYAEADRRMYEMKRRRRITKGLHRG